MRALLWMVPDGASTPGGHVTQWHKTADALRAIGVDAQESDAARPNLKDVDVVHGFGLVTDQIRRARERRIPVVLSTIYWSSDYGAQGPGGNITSAVKARMRMAALQSVRSLQGRHRAVARALSANEHLQALAFESADLLLPNSDLEADAIRCELGVTTPMEVVPNSVDPNVFTLPETEQPRSGVLYVGRLEPHKNQLGLIRALADTDVGLTIVGPEHPDHPDYAARCRREGQGRVRFLGPREPEQLVELYRGHAVHVLPSFFETTGLVSLEAALCGAAVVTTDRGYARAYFGHEAEYCNPSSPASIRTSVERSLTRGPSSALRRRILEQFCWSATAKATAAAYDHVLAGTPGDGSR